MFMKSRLATLAGMCLALGTIAAAADATLIGRYSFEESPSPNASWYFLNTVTSPGTTDALSKYVTGGNTIATGQGPVVTANSTTDHYAVFDGNDFIACPGGFLDNTTSWTVSIWFNGTTSALGKKMIGSTSSLNGDGFALELSNESGHIGQVRYAQRTGGAWSSVVYSDSTKDDGQWHNAIVTYNGTNFWMYIDGVKQVTIQSDTQGTTNAVTDGAVNIGAYASNAATDKWIGGLDEVRIYNNAVTDADALTIYQGSRLVPEPATLLLMGGGLAVLAYRRRAANQ